MEESAVFYIVNKKTGKLVHHFSVGEYSFYKRTTKKTGYAQFSCSETNCKAYMSCRYTSYEAALTDEEPEMLLCYGKNSIVMEIRKDSETITIRYRMNFYVWLCVSMCSDVLILCCRTKTINNYKLVI